MLWPLVQGLICMHSHCVGSDCPMQATNTCRKWISGSVCYYLPFPLKLLILMCEEVFLAHTHLPSFPPCVCSRSSFLDWKNGCMKFCLPRSWNSRQYKSCCYLWFVQPVTCEDHAEACWVDGKNGSDSVYQCTMYAIIDYTVLYGRTVLSMKRHRFSEHSLTFSLRLLTTPTGNTPEAPEFGTQGQHVGSQWCLSERFHCSDNCHIMGGLHIRSQGVQHQSHINFGLWSKELHAGSHLAQHVQELH